MNHRVVLRAWIDDGDPCVVWADMVDGEREAIVWPYPDTAFVLRIVAREGRLLRWAQDEVNACDGGAR